MGCGVAEVDVAELEGGGIDQHYEIIGLTLLEDSDLYIFAPVNPRQNIDGRNGNYSDSVYWQLVHGDKLGYYRFLL